MRESEITTRGSWTRVPWKNGLGTSNRILERPDLVLNRTEIAVSAAFSAYCGFDRVLTLVAGELALDIDGRLISLKPPAAHRFPGEAKVNARPGESGADVFNVLVDRSRWRIAALHSPAGDQGLTIVHVGRGDATLEGGLVLHEGDTLVTTAAVQFATPNETAILWRLQPSGR